MRATEKGMERSRSRSPACLHVSACHNLYGGQNSSTTGKLIKLNAWGHCMTFPSHLSCPVTHVLCWSIFLTVWKERFSFGKPSVVSQLWPVTQFKASLYSGKSEGDHRSSTVGQWHDVFSSPFPQPSMCQQQAQLAVTWQPRPSPALSITKFDWDTLTWFCLSVS